MDVFKAMQMKLRPLESPDCLHYNVILGCILSYGVATVGFNDRYSESTSTRLLQTRVPQTLSAARQRTPQEGLRTLPQHAGAG